MCSVLHVAQSDNDETGNWTFKRAEVVTPALLNVYALIDAIGSYAFRQRFVVFVSADLVVAPTLILTTPVPARMIV